MLIPALAKIIDRDLIKHGVTIVNVQGTSFLRFSKIFQMKGENKISIPISIVTDLDKKPNEKDGDEQTEEEKKTLEIKKEKYKYGTNTRTFVSHKWTLEYCLAKSEIIGPIILEIYKKIKQDDDIVIEDFITELEKGSLNKTDLAYELSKKLETSELDKEVIENDIYIHYLIEAITHATE